MSATSGIVGDSLVYDDDFGRVPTRLEAHRDALGVGLRIQSPRIDKPMCGLDRFEFAADPDDATVGKAVGNAILSPDPEIDLRIGAFDPRRPPPCDQLLRTRPCLE
jgi:hypothetical protein